MGTSFGSEAPVAAAVDIAVVRHRLARAGGRPDGIGAGAAGGVDPERESLREVSVQIVAVVVGTAIHRNA